MKTGRMSPLKKTLLQNSIPAICLLFIIGISFFRLFFSIELTDESYYIASSYRFFLGNIPFYDAWEATIGSSLLTFPVLWIHQMLIGASSAVFIYSRVSYYLFVVILSSTFILAFKDILGKTMAVLAATFFVVMTPFSILNWSYNNLSLSLLGAGLFLLLYALQHCELKRKSNMAIFLAGILHGFMCIAYISMVFTAVAVAVLFFALVWYRTKNRKSAVQYFLTYSAAGFTVALFMLIVLLAITKGQLFLQLGNILSNPFNPFRNLSVFYRARLGLEELVVAIKISGFSLIIALLALSILRLLRKKYSFLVLLQPFILLILTTQIPIGDLATVDFSFRASLMLIIFLPSWKQYRISVQNSILLLSLSGLIHFTVISLTSAGLTVQGRYGFFTITLALLVVMLEDIRLYFASQQIFEQKTALFLRHLSTCLAVLMFSGIIILFWYIYPYRSNDGPISQMSTQVQGGVFQGIYCSAYRADYVQQLEDRLRQLQKPGGSVAFIGTAPYVYMMTDMRPTVPSVWRIAFSTRPYIGLSANWLALYMQSGDEFMPDQIYFLNDTDYQAFLKFPDHELSQIILLEYELSHEEANDLFYIRLFEKK